MADIVNTYFYILLSCHAGRPLCVQACLGSVANFVRLPRGAGGYAMPALARCRPLLS